MEEERKGFKFNLDAPLSADEKNGAKPAGRSNTGALVLLLIGFVIVGTLTVWMYYHFHERLDAVNSMGSAEIANISGQLNREMSEVSGQMNDQYKLLQKQTENLEGGIKQLSQSVAAIDKSKPDKKELETALARIQSLSSDISKQFDELKRQSQTLSSTVATLADQMQNDHGDIGKNAAGIEKITGNYVNKETLETTLAKEREFYSKNMAHATEALFNEIAMFNETINKLSDRVNALEPPKPLPNVVRQPAPALPDPKPGKIVEQEIVK